MPTEEELTNAITTGAGSGTRIAGFGNTIPEGYAGDVFTWNQPNQSAQQGWLTALQGNIFGNYNLPINPQFNMPSVNSLSNLNPGQWGLNSKLSGYQTMDPQRLPDFKSTTLQTTLENLANAYQTPPNLPTVPGQIDAVSGLPINSDRFTLNPSLRSLYGKTESSMEQPQTDLYPQQLKVLNSIADFSQNPMLKAAQNQVSLKHNRERQDLEQSLYVRGLGNSTIRDQALRDLQAQQDDEMTMLMGNLYNTILPTQVNALQGLQGMNLAQSGQDTSTLLNAIQTQEQLQQGQFGRTAGARQLGGQEQAQLFGQGLALNQQSTGSLLNFIQALQGLTGQDFTQGLQQRGLSLSELLQQTGAQAALQETGFRQGVTANQLGFGQDLQTRAYQGGLAESLANQMQTGRGQSLQEFLSLLNSQNMLDTTNFNQANASIGQMLAALGMTGVPNSIPGYTVPVPGLGAAGAAGDIFGDILTAGIASGAFGG